MDAKKFLLAAAALLLCASMVSAADPVVDVLTGDDGNYFYPSGASQTLRWTLSDADNPSDVNVQIRYVRINLTTLNRDTNTLIIDGNLTDFCTGVVVTSAVPCSYSWTLPADFDSNYAIDVNVFDMTTGDDANDSASVYIDTNACTMARSVAGDGTVTLTTTCSGYGQDGNFGGPTSYYSTDRTGQCGSNYTTYTVPFRLTFGEITTCYYSVDSLSNTETTQAWTQTYSSSAYSLALLVEMVLAAGLLITIGVLILGWKGADPKTILTVVIGAVVVAIMILVFGTIL